MISADISDEKKENQELQKYLFDFEIYEIAKLVFKK